MDLLNRFRALARRAVTLRDARRRFFAGQNDTTRRALRVAEDDFFGELSKVESVIDTEPTNAGDAADRLRQAIGSIPEGWHLVTRDDELMLVPADVLARGRSLLPHEARRVVVVGRVGATEAA